jgi:hypothetical protein
MMSERVSEVPVHNRAEPGKVLIQYALVQTKLLAKLVRNGGRNRRREEDRGRISRQEARDHKDQSHKPEEEGNGMKNPSYQEPRNRQAVVRKM